MQLPCQHRERIEGMVCSHSVQLSRLIRTVQSKGIYLQPSPVQLAGWRVCRVWDTVLLQGQWAGNWKGGK